jgi:hypothetical protein
MNKAWQVSERKAGRVPSGMDSRDGPVSSRLVAVKQASLVPA